MLQAYGKRSGDIFTIAYILLNEPDKLESLSSAGLSSFDKCVRAKLEPTHKLKKRLEEPVGTKHSSLLCTFVSYKENEQLGMWPLGLYTQYSIFFVSYE